MSNILELKLKKLHPAQKQILAESKRFNVLKCGRRFGKTELSIDLAVNTMLDGDPVGFWAPTYKDLYEVWSDFKNVLYPVIKEKNEQVKQIILLTGGKIDFWSMEDPDSGRGRKYKRAIIDEAEKAHKFKEAWNSTIRPTLTDYQGDAWILSTPKLGKTFFKEVFQFKDKFEDWMSWQKSTYDNPHILPSEVDAAKNQLDDITFRVEYMAEDLDMIDKPYMYCFENKHISTTIQLNDKDTFYLSFDFNVDPITCIVAQLGHDFIHVLDEFRLRNSNLYELSDAIKAKYGQRHYIITGDASGLSRHVTNKGNLNNYSILLSELGLSERQLKIPSINPSINESRTLSNSIFARHPNVYIHERCKYLIEDLKFVQVKDDGGIDKTSNVHRGHLLDTIRYLFNSFKGNFIIKK